MWTRPLRFFANLLVVAYAGDAIVSVSDDTVDLTGITMVRTTLAGFVLLLSAVALPLLGLSRRLPLSVFVPIIASTFWFSLGAVPLNFAYETERLWRALAFAQLAIAGVVFLRIRWLRDGEGWLFDEAWFSEHRFSLRYLLGYSFASIATLAVTTTIVAGFAVTKGLESMSRGFVRFDRQGVSLAARHYVRDEKSIRLIGMIHIGERKSYQALFRDLGRATRTTVVLTEGVTDRDRLLGAKLSYAPLADFLGVDEQEAIEQYVEPERAASDAPTEGPDFVHADVDVNRFDPITIEWLMHTASIYSSTDPLDAFLRVYEEAQRDPDAAEVALEDLIQLRNDHLVSRLEALLPEYEQFVVPWGALHLPGIEASIEAMGFERTSSSYTPLITWSRVAGAIVGAQAAQATLPPGEVPAAVPAAE